MTYNELLKIPFHFVSHLSLENQHQTTYTDDSGRLGFCDTTEKKGFYFGKTVRSYRIDTKWYENKKDFIKALKKFSYSEIPNNCEKGSEE
jgi:hypothetical protein